MVIILPELHIVRQVFAIRILLLAVIVFCRRHTIINFIITFVFIFIFIFLDINTRLLLKNIFLFMDYFSFILIFTTFILQGLLRLIFFLFIAFLVGTLIFIISVIVVSDHLPVESVTFTLTIFEGFLLILMIVRIAVCVLIITPLFFVDNVVQIEISSHFSFRSFIFVFVFLLVVAVWEVTHITIKVLHHVNSLFLLLLVQLTVAFLLLFLVPFQAK
mmetsp:Transcript_3540/g.6395  ORF Transcript_3540/g.6395 Transcript_3540/m.6395 type:complete len:217 (+) Transcript_3540:2355-3005(+)